MNLDRLKAKFVGEKCTLNGKPAILTGRYSKHARIVSFGEELPIEWEEAIQIMRGNRQFKVDKHRDIS